MSYKMKLYSYKYLNSPLLGFFKEEQNIERSDFLPLPFSR